VAQELELDPCAAGEDAIAPLARLAELRLRHGRIEEAERPRSRRSSTLGAACRADEAAALVLLPRRLRSKRSARGAALAA